MKRVVLAVCSVVIMAFFASCGGDTKTPPTTKSITPTSQAEIGSRSATAAQVAAKAGLSSTSGVGGGGRGKPSLSKITRAFKSGKTTDGSLDIRKAGEQGAEGLASFKASLKAYREPQAIPCGSGSFTATTTVSSDRKTLTTTLEYNNCKYAAAEVTSSINGKFVVRETDDEYGGTDPEEDFSFEPDNGSIAITDFTSEESVNGVVTSRFTGNGDFMFEDKAADGGNFVSMFKANGTFSDFLVENGITVVNEQIVFTDFNELITYQFSSSTTTTEGESSNLELSRFTEVLNGSINFKNSLDSEDDFGGSFTDFTTEITDGANMVTMEVSGKMSADCLGGEVTFKTVTPIQFDVNESDETSDVVGDEEDELFEEMDELSEDIGDACPVAGVITMTNTSGIVTITFTSNGGMNTQADNGTTESFTTCQESDTCG